MLTSIESAAFVYFGEFQPIEDISERVLPAYQETPEDTLIRKETLKELSLEGKELVDIVLSLPAECFLMNGKGVKKGSLYKICREKKGWTKEQTEAIKMELRFFLKAMNPSARRRIRCHTK